VNQERGLSGDLLGADVPHLLPLRRYNRVTPSGKRRSTETALFPGYLFITGDKFDRLNVLSVGRRRVVSLIPVFDVAALIRDLSMLMDAIESGAEIGSARAKLKPGTPVRVTSGPLEGTEGTFEGTGRRGTLLIHIRALGQVVPVSIEEHRVEVIG
jgi:transcription antitermination factor NusG